MFNQQHRHLWWQSGHGLQQLFALASGHASNRLVQQQHSGLARQGNGNFKQAALAISQFSGGLAHHFGEVKLVQQGLAALHHLRVFTQGLPPTLPQAQVLRHRHGQSFQRRERVKQLVDLKGAHHATSYALVRGQTRDVLTFQNDLPLTGLQHSGEQIDEGGFARAVGANQGMARALPEF